MVVGFYLILKFLSDIDGMEDLPREGCDIGCKPLEIFFAQVRICQIDVHIDPRV